MYQYYKPIIISLSSILCTFVPTMVKGEYIKTGTLLNLSIEELMNVEVTTPSRRGEKQLFAPGVVTVVTAQEIRQFGARHLGDVLDRIVSTQIVGSHPFPYSKISLRATNTWLNDVNVLLLLNGRPIRDERVNSDIYSGFPLGMVDHLEIIRGPGSVIYGTNAMAGVINIVTHGQKNKSDQDDPNSTSPEQLEQNFTELDLSIGSFNRQQIQLATTSQAEDYNLTAGINFLEAEGDNFEDMTDERGLKGTYQTGEGNTNLVASGNYKGLSFNAMLVDSFFDDTPIFFQLPSVNFHRKRSFFDVGYQHHLTDVWQASFHYTSSRTTTTWLYNREDKVPVKVKAKDQLLDLVIQGQPMEKLNILLGANYSLLGPSIKYYSQVWRMGAFTQADYSLTEKRKIIAGIQWNKAEETKGEFSPRIGLIQGFGEAWWLKLLYSEAFRSPSLVELFANSPSLLGNRNLKAERMATIDVQLVYQTTSHYFTLTFYHSRFTDMISQTPSLTSRQVLTVNKGEIDFNGVEFEGRMELNDKVSLVGNASYQRNKDEKGIQDNTFAPSVMAKLGITYTGKNGMNLALFHSYIGEAPDLSETIGNPAINPQADAYHLLTANLLLDTGKLWKIGKPDHSFVSLYLDNLLNEKIYAPDIFHRSSNNTIPHHWGFGAYLNYQYRF